MTIFLDFDDVIVDSNSKIKPLTTQEELLLFENDSYYDSLKFKPDILNVLHNIQNIYHIVILFKGSEKGLLKIQKWLDDNFPCEYRLLKLTNKIDMSNGIQISNNLFYLQSNAMLKILYKDFQKILHNEVDVNNEYIIANTWQEIESVLNFYNFYNIQTLERIR